MTAVLMDGRKISEEIKSKIKEEVGSFIRDGITPCLATVLVGEDPASKIYLRIKHTNCEKVGIKSENYQLSEDIEEKKLIEFIDELNKNESVHGILLQLPLPPHLDSYDAISSISPDKDVDGLHPYNVGRLSSKRYNFIPCTPEGIIVMLSHYNIDIDGKHAVIIGRSDLVGRPVSKLLSYVDPLQMLLFNTDTLLLNSNATVTTCHSRTKNLDKIIRDADILISAVGRRYTAELSSSRRFLEGSLSILNSIGSYPDLKRFERDGFIVTKRMIKKSSVVIDVGVNKIEGKIYGDIDFEGVKKKAGYLTPNPGGVGPMTVAMLLYNTLIATSKQTKHERRLRII
ncbi:MAG: bifunctional 5,10-methylene-tetrahydrofolate dehydrogenase/5,10-methylene-tetrahydrofolate cyclohydrolase [Candidatus Methylarchaceae archaeon HK02M1]|nr:bifunctional 5,10-methylene-tetrahydrofolate dehydrogenase/5,10-methylene-tetrahydrofolate cyclohydrolase [Candidatus Methylarchaceae archaeon HK01M]MCP8312057.1 bifunctional 5,10-methylene-tetrahydrofolate dehydrogenase/5,10-methylene-tetrahydrofolate cyclohydrolase [Candidatus Methylarchaceae archaeon HK02M1]